VGEVRDAYDFTDLQSFLDLYYEATRMLVHERDFYDLAFAYITRAASQGVRHAEIFFDPQAHTDRGVDLGTVITVLRRALLDGQRRLGVSSHLILCFLRHLSSEAAVETLRRALPYKEWFVAAWASTRPRPATRRKCSKRCSRRRRSTGFTGWPRRRGRSTRVHQAGPGRTWGGAHRPRRQVRGGSRADSEAARWAGAAHRLPAV
jgi:hypothetical protein